MPGKWQSQDSSPDSKLQSPSSEPPHIPHSSYELCSSYPLSSTVSESFAYYNLLNPLNKNRMSVLKSQFLQREGWGPGRWNNLSKLIQLLSGAACIQVSVFSQDRYIQAAAIFLEFFFLLSQCHCFITLGTEREEASIKHQTELGSFCLFDFVLPVISRASSRILRSCWLIDNAGLYSFLGLSCCLFWSSFAR